MCDYDDGSSYRVEDQRKTTYTRGGAWTGAGGSSSTGTSSEGSRGSGRAAGGAGCTDRARAEDLHPRPCDTRA